MTTSHETGPLVVFGQSYLSGVPEYNPDHGTSLFFAGSGVLDQRTSAYWCYRPGNNSYQGWLGIDNIFSINCVPAALATANIAALQVPTTAVALALVTANSAGFTISASVVNAATGVTATGLLLLDGITASFTGSVTANVLFAASVANGALTVGSAITGTNLVTQTIIGMAGENSSIGGGTTGTYIVTPGMVTATTQITMTGNAGVAGVPLIPGNANVVGTLPGSSLGIPGPKLYNPACMLGRNVRITSQTSDVAVYTVRGYDVYGFAMTEAITAAGAGTVSGKKAFKYIASVTPVGTLGANVAVGTGDVFGFPLASLSFQDVAINYSSTVITASTGYLAMDLTNPATSTTGDIRGTYAVQSASDGSKRLVVYQNPQATNVVSSNGLYGVTQV